MAKCVPHPVDVELGRRLEAARVRSGLTLRALAPAAGVTWQQLRKYELAADRVTVSRLWAIARALDKSMTSFVRGLDAIQEARRAPRRGPTGKK